MGLETCLRRTQTSAILRGMLVTVLLAWSGYWLVDGYHYMHEHSVVMQQGFGSDGIQMWEIFNLKMAAAHHFLRWLPGAVLLLIASGSASTCFDHAPAHRLVRQPAHGRLPGCPPCWRRGSWPA
jgi:hypothetical protein